MNEFTSLRHRAKFRRDKLIEAAHAEYSATLVQIEKLQLDMLGRTTTRRKSLARCVDSVIPTDAPFTCREIIAKLEALDPGRLWHQKNVTVHLTRLREKGIVKRIKRAAGNDGAVYARAELDVKVAPLDDLTLLETIKQVLVKPMTATEVALAVVEAGYRTHMPPSRMRNYVVRKLGQGKFKRVGEKWMAG